MMNFDERLNMLRQRYQALLDQDNAPIPGNGVFERYAHPVLTAGHAPLHWRYDLNPATNPYLMERFGIHAVMNAGAIKWKGRYLLAARVEGADRKSFFAMAESDNGTQGFRFWDRPVVMPEYGEPATNVYDMRLTEHEDGWIYGIFCVERRDPAARKGDLSAAVVSAGVARTRDFLHWERLPDIVSATQQRNVVLHPEFVNGKYALYTRPQDGFIEAGSGAGIGWALVDSMESAVIKDEIILNERHYHTVKESKNGEGPAPIKTSRGWLHLAHGVRGCASGLRYVLYLYMTALDDPSRVIAEPAGFFMAPEGDEYTGDVMNVLFSNGWILDDDGRVLIYYASSDTRLHVATSSVERLVDYCLNTAPDGLRTGRSVEILEGIIERNQAFGR